jgi:hypothetical protein
VLRLSQCRSGPRICSLLFGRHAARAPGIQSPHFDSERNQQSRAAIRIQRFLRFFAIFALIHVIHTASVVVGPYWNTVVVPVVNSGYCPELAARLLQCALSLALLERGWNLPMEPGQLFLSRDDFSLQPPTVFTKLQKGELSAQGWSIYYSTAGIGELAAGSVQRSRNSRQCPLSAF